MSNPEVLKCHCGNMTPAAPNVGNFYRKLTGRWFPQIVQWESISNIYITKIVVLVSEPVRGRSRATELPCFLKIGCHGNTLNHNKAGRLYEYFVHFCL